MAEKRISDLPAASAITGNELIEVSQASDVVKVTAATISAAAADNSFNDSGNGFVTAGFIVGDRVQATGFANAGNNVFVGVVTAVTAGKLTIAGADGDSIVNEAAGPNVTIAKWTTRRAAANALGGGTAKVPPSLTPFTQVIGSPVLKKINGRGLRLTNTGGATSTALHGYLRPVPAGSFELNAIFQGSQLRRDGNGIACAILTTTGQLLLSGQFLDGVQKQQTQRWNSSTSRTTVNGSVADGGQITAVILSYNSSANSLYGGTTDYDFFDLTDAERNNLGYTVSDMSGVPAYAGIVYAQNGNLNGAGVCVAYRDWDFSFDLRPKAR